MVLTVAVVIGTVVAALVEFRLRAMRDLFRDALMQRESFDAVARGISSRQDRHEARAEREEKRVDGLVERVSRLEGKRLSTT